MSTQPPGRVVEFSVNMRPKAVMEILQPPGVPSNESPIIDPTKHPEPTGDEVREMHRGTRGGILLMRILSMSPQDRRDAAMAAAQEDPLVVWFALLTREERAQFIAAAERDLKQRVTE